MKKNYKTPEMDVIDLKDTDIVTASGSPSAVEEVDCTIFSS